jgi:3-hydroxybutyryl-CoA dehydrogenase
VKIGVVGAGAMGAGIAQVCAMSGYEVVLFDIHSSASEKALVTIKKNLNKAVELGKINIDTVNSALSKVNTTNNIEEVKADLIIEAIVELIEPKLQIFNKLAEINDEKTIYASNTSSIPLTKIAAGFKYPKQMVGIHFFNPAHIMKLVEIIKAEQTANDVIKTANEFVANIKKTSILAADAPGFIVNRVARHFYVESLKILEENVASLETIDDLIRSYGFKMGPFQLMDLIGVETNLSVTQSMYELFNYDSKFRPSRIQQKKVQAGYYGRKTKKGFYNYE